MRKETAKHHRTASSPETCRNNGALPLEPQFDWVCHDCARAQRDASLFITCEVRTCTWIEAETAARKEVRHACLGVCALVEDHMALSCPPLKSRCGSRPSCHHHPSSCIDITPSLFPASASASTIGYWPRAISCAQIHVHGNRTPAVVDGAATIVFSPSVGSPEFSPNAQHEGVPPSRITSIVTRMSVVEAPWHGHIIIVCFISFSWPTMWTDCFVTGFV